MKLKLLKISEKLETKYTNGTFLKQLKLLKSKIDVFELERSRSHRFDNLFAGLARKQLRDTMTINLEIIGEQHIDHGIGNCIRIGQRGYD